MSKVVQKIHDFFSKDFPVFAAMPALVWQMVFSIVPLLTMFVYSIIGTQETRNFLGFFTLDFYLNLCTYIYFKVLMNSLILAFGTIIFSLLFCLVAAYALAFLISRRYQAFCLVLMTLPLWTNFIVRIYSWFFLLDKRGILASVLLHAGVMEKNTTLLFNSTAMIIGMVYCYYPFMLLPLYVSMSSIKPELLEASADLGAGAFTTLKTLIIPSCWNEIIVSSGTVGLMAFGEFAIPQLLGGSKYAFWGSVVTSQFSTQHDFKSGAAFTFMGLASIGIICLALYLLWRLICWLRAIDLETFLLIKQHYDQE